MTTSTSRTVPLAFPWPLGLAVAALALWALDTGLAALVPALRDGGAFAFALVPIALVAAGAASLLVTFGAPRPFALAAVLVPWLASALFSSFGAHQVTAAVASVAPDERALLLAEGIAEVIVMRVLGATATAGAALGVAVALAVRMRADGPAALASAGLSLVTSALAFGSVVEARGLREMFSRGFAVSPADRAAVAAEGMASMAHGHELLLVVAGAAAVGALGVVVATRKDVAGALVCAALVPLAPFADRRVLDEPARLAEHAAGAPWLDIAGFTPIDVDGEPQRDVDAFLTDKQLVVAGAAVPATLDAEVTALQGASPDLVVAVDRRASAKALALLVRAATAAGRTKLHLAGARTGAPPALDVDALSPLERLAAALLAPAPAASTMAQLGCADIVADNVSCRPVSPTDTPDSLVAALAKARKDGAVVALGDPPPPRDAARDTAGGVLGALGDGALASLFEEPGAGGGGVGARGVFGTIGVGGGGGGGLGARGRGTGQGTSSGGPVLGSLDKEIVRRVVSRHAPEVRLCYERALVKNPDLEGRVTLKWVIASDGRVTQVQVSDDKLNDASVAACLRARAMTWTFPAPKGGGIVVVQYPFAFTSAR